MRIVGTIVPTPEFHAVDAGPNTIVPDAFNSLLVVMIRITSRVGLEITRSIMRYRRNDEVSN